MLLSLPHHVLGGGGLLTTTKAHIVAGAAMGHREHGHYGIAGNVSFSLQSLHFSIFESCPQSSIPGQCLGQMLGAQ